MKLLTVKEFVALLGTFESRLQEIGDNLCLMVDRDPKIYDKIVKEEPRLTYNFLAGLERIGRKVLTPMAFMDSSPARQFAVSLPVSEQEKLYNEPVAILRHDAGKAHTTLVNAQNLSREELRQLIDSDKRKIRSVTEQSDYVSRFPVQVPKAKPATRYSIQGDRLVIHPTRTTWELSLQQLDDIRDTMMRAALKELTKKK